MFAVLGVTGKVGGATARALLREGRQVRVLVRDEAKGEEWRALGAEVAVASLEDASQLERGFQDVEGAFVMTPPYYQSLDPRQDNELALASLTHSLQAAHVPKVVFLSSVGAQHAEGTGAILKLHDMEQTLFALGIDAAAIRAAFFMENFQPLLEHARSTGKLPTTLNPLDHAIPMIATADIGETAAALLTDSTWFGNRIIELEGPEAYSPRDAAGVFTRVLGTAVVAEVVPAPARAPLYEQFGFSHASALSMAEMAEGFDSGRITFEGGEALHERGRTTLAEVYGG